MTPFLAATNVVKQYPHRTGLLRRTTGWVRAVDGVTLEIHSGETVGLVGESGSGKSTLARLLVGLITPTAGDVTFQGTSLRMLPSTDVRRFRRSVQLLFQSPLMSFNPRMRIRDIVAEPLEIHRLAEGQVLRDRVIHLLEEVMLEPQVADRYPQGVSGGQRQRVAIARALAVNPELLICDEPVASLDLTVQRQILELLLRLQATRRMAMLFISHHLGVVGAVAHRVAVMYLGRIVEVGGNPEIFLDPRHPYTQALVASVTPPPALAAFGGPFEERWPSSPRIFGDPGSSLHIPSGCRFHPRCPLAEPRCREEDPPLIPRRDSRPVACHFA